MQLAIKYSEEDKLESKFPKICNELKGNCDYLALEESKTESCFLQKHFFYHRAISRHF